MDEDIQWTVADHQHEAQVELRKEDPVWQATRKEQLEQERRLQRHTEDGAHNLVKAMQLHAAIDRDISKMFNPMGGTFTRDPDVLMVPAEEHRKLCQKLVDLEAEKAQAQALLETAKGGWATAAKADARLVAALDLVDRFEIIVRDLFQKTMKGGRIWRQCCDALAALEEFKHGCPPTDARPHALGDSGYAHGPDCSRPDGAGVGGGQLPGQDKATFSHGAAPEILCASCFHPCGPDGAALSLRTHIARLPSVTPCPGCKGHHLLHVKNRHRVHEVRAGSVIRAGDLLTTLNNGQVVSLAPQLRNDYAGKAQVKRK